MNVYVAGDCEEYSESVAKRTNLSVIIPLTDKTISIDTSDNITEKESFKQVNQNIK